MSVNWEFLAGDTSKFALRISLASDPYEGQGVTSDVSASWGGFEFWVEGHNLCAQTDAGASLDSVQWYLLPFLEWLVENWDPIFHEERLPIEAAGATATRSLRETAYAALDGPTHGASAWQPWWSRHCLSAARTGGLFPEIILRRWRDSVEISWDSLIIPGAPPSLSFTAPTGSTRMPPQDVAVPLFRVLEATTTELLIRCPDSPRISQLADATSHLSDPSLATTRTAWLAGLGANLDEMRRRWSEVIGRMTGPARELTEGLAEPLFVAGTPKAALMFGAVAPNVTAHDVDVLTGFLLTLYESNTRESDAADQADLLSSIDSRSAPWRQGYDLAGSFLDSIGADLLSPVDVDALLGSLGVEISAISLDDREIRGLAVAGSGHRPCVAWNQNYPFNDRVEVQRFTKGHELCHVLFDRTSGRDLAEASGPWAPVELEQRANAFAAMILMPELLLDQEFQRKPEARTDTTELAAVAARLGVSVRALAWHAANLGLIPRVIAEKSQLDFRSRSGFLTFPAT